MTFLKQVVVVAGGSGSRMKSDQPKQFIAVAGRPILMHTLECFLNFDPATRLILVLPKDHHSTWKDLCAKHGFTHPVELVSGGATRYHSVQAGMALAQSEGVIAVHDGVRPMVSTATLKRCFETAWKEGNAIPALAVVETLRKLENDGSSTWVNRDAFRSIQTPQCFRYDIIQTAYQQEYNEEFTDDASVVERMGVSINLVEGNRENLKITTPEDLHWAEYWLQKKSGDGKD
ncbi:2-C-methyl-D-erythritol 4-phosphate cytidylyltransferase [bacterium SCSIO 12741]|nr:2-C-methyl-D-erythritol 4-phosphate cytidylyltransferase [bacterium SCSIO 12741]